MVKFSCEMLQILDKACCWSRRCREEGECDSNFPTPAVPLAGKDRGMLCALDKRVGTWNKWLLFPLLCLMCSLLLDHVNKLPSSLFNQWAELHGVL